VATLEVRHDSLVVTLASAERMAAMRRELCVPLASIASVCCEEDPWSAIRGIRATGIGLPGIAAYGVRRMTGDRPDFIAVHGRGAAVRVELGPGSHYRRLLVTVVDPGSVVAGLRTLWPQPEPAPALDPTKGPM
jgi:hypothetical protein